MRLYEERIAEATKIKRKLLHADAKAFGRACKGVWPNKTAEHLASLAGCSVRAAAYQLSGKSNPSLECIHALLTMFAESVKSKRVGANEYSRRTSSSAQSAAGENERAG